MRMEDRGEERDGVWTGVDGIDDGRGARRGVDGCGRV